MKEMFCTSCNIQFSSMKTYRGHKEFYCAMRHRSKEMSPRGQGSESVEPPASGVPGPMLPAGVPPPGTVLPPGTAFPVQGLLGGSIPMPPAQTPQGMVIATPVVGPDGLTNVTFNVPTIVMPPVLGIPPTNSVQAHQGSSPTTNKPAAAAGSAGSAATGGELPLDLSKKKEGDEDSSSPSKRSDNSSPAEMKPLIVKNERDQEPEDLSTKSSSKSAKSPVASLSSSRPSTPGSQAGSQRSSPAANRLEQHASPQLVPGIPGLPHPAMVNPALLAAAMQSQQAQVAAFSAQAAHLAAAAAAAASISKCTECNIVFYKHENFIIHKEHYCSGRRRKNSGKDSDAGHGDSTPMIGDRPPMDLASPRSSDSSSPIVALNGSAEAIAALSAKAISDVLTVEESLLQYFCHPCKIKFSSHDTLKAHQEYYCPARAAVEAQSSTGDRGLGGAGGSRSPAGSSAGSHSGADTPDSEGNYPCQYCNNTYPSSRLLKHHFCK